MKQLLNSFFKKEKGIFKILLSSLLVLNGFYIYLFFSGYYYLLPLSLYVLLNFKRSWLRIVKRKGSYLYRNEAVSRIMYSLLPYFFYMSSIEELRFVEAAFYMSLPLIVLLEPFLLSLLRRGHRSTIQVFEVGYKTKTVEYYISIVGAAHFLILTIALAMSVTYFYSFLAVTLFAIELAVLLFSAYLIYKKIGTGKNKSKTVQEFLEQQCNPVFMVYFSAPPKSEYQLIMWLKYLNDIGLSYVIVVRKKYSINALLTETESPIILCPKITDLDTIMVGSIRACFYVNNGMQNSHMVRFGHIKHIQLLHGDSDKATSYNPVTKMFDKVFVAGQAGIDRYINHGINIPLSNFEIVGRPQVEYVKRCIKNKVETVLYAPTWHGNFEDTNYTSLLRGVEIVSSLINIGLSVIFRPHPYSYKDPVYVECIKSIHAILKNSSDVNNIAHVWGDMAEKELTIFECFNLADAMISDVSSVVPDFLYSEKPFAITAMYGDRSEFEEAFPLSKAAYIIEHDMSNLDNVIEEILTVDSKRECRKKARVYYLGDFSADNYASNFSRIAKEIILK